MKNFTSLFLLGVAVGAYAQSDPSWDVRTPVGYSLSARADAGMVAFDSKLYILGGYDGCGPKNFSEYDPATGALAQLPRLGSGCANPITGAVMFYVGGKIYSFSGNGLNRYDIATASWTMLSLAAGLLPDTGFQIGNVLYIASKSGNGFFAYDTTTDTYAQKADLPDAANRREAISFSVDGKGYYGGGTVAPTNGCTTENGCFLTSFYEYDPVADTWTARAPMPQSIVFGTAVGYGGMGYAGLGEVYSPVLMQRVKSSKWFRFDPAANAWSAMQNFMGASDTDYYNTFSETASALLDGDIYIFGGKGNGNYNNYTDNVYKYDIGANAWSLVDGDPGKNRTEAAGFYLDGKIYIGGGHDSEALNDFWQYDIASDSWTQKANLPFPHTQRACVELNGKGYFIGGYGKSVTPTDDAWYLDTMLEYDPATDAFTAKAPYPARRAGMIAFVHNGKIYAGAGNTATGNPTNSFYMYDPVTDSWSPKAAVPFAQANLSFFVLGNTGYAISYYPQLLMAKYDFATDSWTTEPHTLDSSNSIDYTNQAFVLNGEAYVVHGAYDGGDRVSKYDPATSTWSHVTNVPFKNASQTIIAGGDEVFIGFGTAGVNGDAGELNSNNWASMRMGADVSDEIGLYYTHVSTTYTGSMFDCGTGLLNPGATVALYDDEGDLFASVRSTTTLSGSTCMEVSATSLSAPFQTHAANYGNGYVEEAMFLNKDLILKNNQSVVGGGVIRLYFTSAELQALVEAFNAAYNQNRTIAQVQIVKYFEYNAQDHDLSNNNIPSGYGLPVATLHPYGDDYYFEIAVTAENTVNGELRAALLTNVDLGVDAPVNARFTLYPNPAESILNISSPNGNAPDAILVTDLTGKRLLQAKGVSAVDIGGLSTGVYIVEVLSGTVRSAHKLVKK